MEVDSIDNSQDERTKLSEDTARLKRLLQSVEEEYGTAEENANSDSDDEEWRPPSPVPGTSKEYDQDEDAGNVSLDLSQLKGADVSGGLPVNSEACLMLNLAYQEILTDTLNQIQTALDYNKEQQTLSRHMMEESAQTRQQGKKGSHRPNYISCAYPYFKDKDGMTAPLNDDTLTRERDLKERSIYMRNKRAVKQSDIQEIADAVKSQVLQKLMRPLMNKKEVLVGNLETLDPKSEKAEELKKIIEDVDETIREICVMPDEDIYQQSVDMSEEIDWVAVSSIATKGVIPDSQVKLSWLNVHNPVIRTTKWMKGEDEKLLKLVAEHQERDWKVIAKALGTGRTPVQCLQRYMTELNPALKSGKWTKEESKLLQEVAENCMYEGHISWVEVAASMEGRTPDQCKKQYDMMAETKDGHVHKWTPQEDELLVSLIEKFGPDRWTKIGEHMPGRRADQCSERWANHLDSSLSFAKFTYTEDRLIWKYCQECELSGEKPKWVRLAKLLPGRTDARLLRRYDQMKMWKAHGDFFNALPENLQEFIRISQQNKPKISNKNHSSKRQWTTREGGWDMTSEEKLLYEADINEDLHVPTSLGFLSAGTSNVSMLLTRHAERFRRIVRTVQALVVEDGVNLDFDEISTVIDLILDSKQAPPGSHKRRLYHDIVNLSRKYSVRNEVLFAKDVKTFIVRQVKGQRGIVFRKPKRRSRMSVIDEKIEHLIANKFLSNQTANAASEKTEVSSQKTSLPEGELKKNYESLVLGLYLKALNVDLEKATGRAERLEKSRPARKGTLADKMKVEGAVTSLLKVMKVDSVAAALDRFPAMRDKIQEYKKDQKGSVPIKTEDREKGVPDAATPSTSTQQMDQDVPADNEQSPDKAQDKSEQEDPLKPYVKTLPPDSARYKMPPLPPTLSSLSAFRLLLKERSNLIETAGHAYYTKFNPTGDAEIDQILSDRHLTYHRRIRTYKNLHDFKMARNRFMAVFLWPALLSSMESKNVEDSDDSEDDEEGQNENEAESGEDVSDKDSNIPQNRRQKKHVGWKGSSKRSALYKARKERVKRMWAARKGKSLEGLEDEITANDPGDSNATQGASEAGGMTVTVATSDVIKREVTLSISPGSSVGTEGQRAENPQEETVNQEDKNGVEVDGKSVRNRGRTLTAPSDKERRKSGRIQKRKSEFADDLSDGSTSSQKKAKNSKEEED